MCRMAYAMYVHTAHKCYKMLATSTHCQRQQQQLFDIEYAWLEFANKMRSILFCGSATVLGDDYEQQQKQYTCTVRAYIIWMPILDEKSW